MSDLKDPRVFFAAERTLLAWNRTSVALMAFGFVVERSGLLLTVLAPFATSPGTAARTLWLGIGFVALGVFAAIYSARQYLMVLRTLNPFEIPRGYASWGGLLLNMAVALMGILLGGGIYLTRV